MGVGIDVYLQIHVARLGKKFRTDARRHSRIGHANSRRNFFGRLAGIFGRMSRGTDGLDWRAVAAGDCVFLYGEKIGEVKTFDGRNFYAGSFKDSAKC